MSRPKQKKQIETLAWITDDEAEFWTSITPVPENQSNKVDSNSSQPNKSPSSSELLDNHRFKFDNSLDRADQRKKTNQKDEDTENIDDSNSKINETSKIDMNFVDRLVQEILRPSSSNKEQSDQTDSNKSEDENSSTNENPVLVKGRVFIDELNEEIDVIRGNIDEETLLNRRSRQAKASVSSIEDNKQFLTQKSS